MDGWSKPLALILRKSRVKVPQSPLIVILLLDLIFPAVLYAPVGDALGPKPEGLSYIYHKSREAYQYLHNGASQLMLTTRRISC